MLAAFAEAARALGRDDYLEVTERNAEFLLRGLIQTTVSASITRARACAVPGKAG
jgi:hypothetical protein